MSPDRFFLGWEKPALHSAVGFFWEHFRAADGLWDLSNLIVVLPGARAGSRLIELLAWHAKRRSQAGHSVALLPPRVMTASQLPNALCQSSVQEVSALESLLIRVHILRTFPTDKLNQLFSALPQPSDPMGWMAVAQSLEELSSELTSAKVTPDNVRDICVRKGLHDSARRWAVLQELDDAYLGALREMGRVRRDEGLKLALQENALYAKSTVVLLANPDLPPILRSLLEDSPCQIVPLVHAPATLAAGFDEMGCLQTDFWQEYPLPLADSQIHIEDKPSDQATAIVEITKLLSAVPDECIVIGLGDEALGPVIERSLEWSGRRARRAINRTLADSAPLRLLSLLAQYSQGTQAEVFAALIRHPDMQAWLNLHVQPPDDEPSWEDTWPVLCDEYRYRKIPLRLSSASSDLSPGLSAAILAIESLLADTKARSLADWSEPLRAMLVSLLGADTYRDDIPEERRRKELLGIIGLTLQQFADLETELPYSTKLSFAEAVQFLLQQVGSVPIPEEHEDGAVELLGWLEMHLDDAPVAILSGFNEGFIPNAVQAEPFLPNSLRSELGLRDNNARYARDAYVLASKQASCKRLHLICGRRNASGEVLAPSRLLFAAPEEVVVQRALTFYREAEAKPSKVALANYGTRYELAQIPRPTTVPFPRAALSVTSFRDYLACPYRFYLKHVCGLRTVDDGSEEMDGSIFGNIAHDVLADFGKWVLRSHDGLPPTDASLLNDKLQQLLAARAAKVFGKVIRPAIEIQLHQLQRRLSAFAEFQAGEAAAGWRITHIEHQLAHTIEIDGEDFLFHGRVDRIDSHPESGYRIIDYKTSNNAEKPAKKHQAKKDEGPCWIDLQLPLYRRMATCLNIDESMIHVGYIQLPHDAKDIGWCAADWEPEEYRAAYATADHIVTQLRAGVFWPPSSGAPAYDDGLSDLCRDHALDRANLLTQTGAPTLLWPGGEALV
jgi:ATP-dependent helicase/nuclease subunit B